MKKLADVAIPDKMNALMLYEYDANPRLEQLDVPQPNKGEVLVKIDSSPVNPSDYSFIRGLYSTNKPMPVVPGFEGSGIVVATGNDFMSKRLLGKNVSCFAPREGNGTWAEYMVTKNNMVIPLKKDVDLEQGSMLMVNPLSVMAMLDIAKKGGHKAIANTAAASALGQMLNRKCQEKGIALVNIVRRLEQADLLKEQGAIHVINSDTGSFRDEMLKIFSELGVVLAFDAVAGQMTFDLMEALPEGGEVMVYGGLSEQAIKANPKRLIFEKKKLSGFWLSEWLTHQHMFKLLGIFGQIQKYIADGNHTPIHKRVSLRETVAGINLYVEKMTEGKILVKPGLK